MSRTTRRRRRAGQHDGHGRWSTLALVDAPGNRGHPTRWFVRTPFACVAGADRGPDDVTQLATVGLQALRKGEAT